MTPVPSFTELVDWTEGRLPTRRAAEIRAQVDSDPRLRDSVEWIQRFVATAGQAPLVPVPPQLHAALRAAFRQRFGDVAGPDRLVLLFDSRRDRATAGVRAIDAGTGIHLAYGGRAADLVLDVYRLSDTAVRVAGQLLLRTEDAEDGADAAGVEVAVHAVDGEAAAASATDALGRFTVERVPAGPGRVHARGGGVDVVAEFDLSPRLDTS